MLPRISWNIAPDRWLDQLPIRTLASIIGALFVFSCALVFASGEARAETLSNALDGGTQSIGGAPEPAAPSPEQTAPGGVAEPVEQTPVGGTTGPAAPSPEQTPSGGDDGSTASTPTGVDPVRAGSGPAGEAVGAVTEPVNEAARPVGETIEAVTEPVEQSTAPVLQPVGESLDEATHPIREGARPVLDPVREVVGPVVAPVEEVTRPVLDPVNEITDPIVDPAPGPVEEPPRPGGEVPTPRVEPGNPAPGPVEEAPSPTREPLDPVNNGPGSGGPSSTGGGPSPTGEGPSGSTGGEPNSTGGGPGSTHEPVGGASRPVSGPVPAEKALPTNGGTSLPQAGVAPALRTAMPVLAEGTNISRNSGSALASPVHVDGLSSHRPAGAEQAPARIGLSDHYSAQVGPSLLSVRPVTLDSAGVATLSDPQPSSPNALPVGGSLAGAGSTGGAGLGCLALFLIFLLGGRFLWSTCEFARPGSALRLAIERPG